MSSEFTTFQNKIAKIHSCLSLLEILLPAWDPMPGGYELIAQWTIYLDYCAISQPKKAPMTQKIMHIFDRFLHDQKRQQFRLDQFTVDYFTTFLRMIFFSSLHDILIFLLPLF